MISPRAGRGMQSRGNRRRGDPIIIVTASLQLQTATYINRVKYNIQYDVLRARPRYSWHECRKEQCVISVLVHTVLFLTLVGTVGMSLVTVVSAVVVAVTGPVFWDAAAAVTFKLDTGARMAAAGFITVIAAVIVCHTRFDFQLWDCFKIQLHGR